VTASAGAAASNTSNVTAANSTGGPVDGVLLVEALSGDEAGEGAASDKRQSGGDDSTSALPPIEPLDTGAGAKGQEGGAGAGGASDGDVMIGGGDEMVGGGSNLNQPRGGIPSTAGNAAGRGSGSTLPQAGGTRVAGGGATVRVIRGGASVPPVFIVGNGGGVPAADNAGTNVDATGGGAEGWPRVVVDRGGRGGDDGAAAVGARRVLEPLLGLLGERLVGAMGR
jgi:hypothetical protein